MVGYMEDYLSRQSVNTQPTFTPPPTAPQGLEKYNAPQYATPYAPRTGPGGYPSGGYAEGVAGAGGLDYQAFTGNQAPQGLPPGLQGDNGFSAIARYALRGSANAEVRLRDAYGAAFARRLGGIASGQNEVERGVGYENRAQGLSTGFGMRSAMERRAQAIRDVGMAGAETAYGLNNDLATLDKGTATELAGVKRDEIGLTFQAYLARKAQKANQQAGYIGALGELGGAAIGAFGGPPAAAASSVPYFLQRP